jgi:PhoPQ-activated pathogenicity-related protein
MKPGFRGAVCLIVMMLASNAQAGLREYVTEPDDTYRFEIVRTVPGNAATLHVVKLTSQTWQGIVWTHWLSVHIPQDLKHDHTALLLIGGGNNDRSGPRESDEARILAMIAAQTGSVVAVLEQVPNQPLFGGKYEDAIIAYTFEQYLNGEGADWPLLFPMVKSAVRAMDTVQAIAAENKVNIQKFVVTGASKRGWTTWLTGAVDARVAAIAPMVIDTLNMPVQTEHQMKVYGAYSSQVDDYTERGLQERSDTPEGRKLLEQIDPYTMRDRYTMPKLILLGTNDPYWNVDSSSFYFPDLPGPKHLHYAANAGHDLNPGVVPAIVAFYQSVLNNQTLPQLSWQRNGDGKLEVEWDGPVSKVLLWQAQSPNRDFRESRWTSTPLEGAGRVEVALEKPQTGWAAYYVEVVFPNASGMPYGLSTTMTVLPDTYPTHDK